MSSYATALAKAKAALEAILDGRVESYSFGGGPAGNQTVKRFDLKKLEEHIDWLETKVAEESDSPLTQSISFGSTG